MTPPDGPLTITTAAPLIRAGDLTPSDLLEQCLRRIDVYEPAVRAWAYLDRERARRDADRLTAEARRGEVRGPLHGIPVGVKDIIDVFDMPTGCGSKLWANSYARRDATCVERLRQAGAVILGKTVTTPYAYLDPPPTRNPWNLDRTPGGSSSGSAAAVACGMCLAALGTQTGGSLIRPASYCGVCCLKPTWMRVSTDGVLPLAPSLDHVGVMANSVRDLAIVFEVIGGYDPYGETTRCWPVPACVRAIDAEVAGVEAEFNRPEPRNRKRFRYAPDMFADRLTPVVAKMLSQFVGDLRSLAHAVAGVDSIALPPLFNGIHAHHRALMAREAAGTHADRLHRHPDDYPPRIRQLVEEGLTLTGQRVSEADFARMELQALEESLFFPDPLVTSATLDPAPTPETTGDAWCNSPWSLLGVPTVSLPVGRSEDGLPLAVQFVGSEYKEDWLLARAGWVEHVFRLDNALKPLTLPPVPA